MNSPYFSVLVPTRNRASLLREALPTVINQTFDDYEIVVSDNNSSDDTREIVHEFMKRCPRIRYVNPGESLSMCAHFDYIYEQSKGQYVCYVSDDDGIVPSALSLAHDAIEKSGARVLIWNHAGYYHRDVPEPAQRGRMWGRVGDGALYLVPSELCIRAYMDFQIDVIWDLVPKMLRAAVHRDLVDQCSVKSGGKFHLPPFPDHSASCHLIATNSNYHVLNLPMYIAGVSLNSNAGISYNRKAKFDDYRNLFAEDLLEGVPYALPYINAPYFYSGIQRFQNLYPEQFRGEINLENYLRMSLNDLLAFKAREDISEELSQLKSHMRRFSGGDEFFEECQAMISSKRAQATVKRKVLKLALGSPLLVKFLTGVRRQYAALRGRQTLNFADVASMTDAVAMAQRSIDRLSTVDPIGDVEKVETLEELTARIR